MAMSVGNVQYQAMSTPMGQIVQGGFSLTSGTVAALVVSGTNLPISNNSTIIIGNMNDAVAKSTSAFNASSSIVSGVQVGQFTVAAPTTWPTTATDPQFYNFWAFGN